MGSLAGRFYRGQRKDWWNLESEEVVFFHSVSRPKKKSYLASEDTVPAIAHGGRHSFTVLMEGDITYVCTKSIPH